MDRHRVISTGDSRSFRPDIHGLRAFAILAVVAYHLAPGMVQGGFIGVDVFFVISGYLITGLILRDIYEGRFSLIGFYARRCRRIVPALVVVLLTVCVLGWFTMLPDEYANLGRNILAGGTFTSNVLLKNEANYFDINAQFKPLLHLWSLGVEEQFYLCWPLALLLIARRRQALLIAGALLIASLAAHLVASKNRSDADFYLIHYRFWELMTGAVLVMFEARRKEPVAWLASFKNIVAWGAMAVLVICTLALHRFTPWLGGWMVLPITATVGLIAAGPGNTVEHRLLGTRPAQLVGSISYPLYLWHWPLLSLLNDFDFGRVTPWVRLAAVAAAFVLAWLTWQFIERPIQRRLTPFTGRLAKRTAMAAVTVLAACALLGIGVQARGGFAGRFPAPLQAVIQDAELSREAWKTQWKTNARCRDRLAPGGALSWCYTDPDRSPTVALWGDSHAAHLYSGLHDIYRARGESLLVLAQARCAPLIGVLEHRNGGEDECDGSNALALELIRQSSSIHTVVLSFRASYYVHGRGFGEHGMGDTLVLENAEPVARVPQDQVLTNGLSRTIRAIEALGKQVILVMQVPELGFDPALCLPRPISSSHTRACSIRRDEAQAWQAEYRTDVTTLQVEHPQMRVFDPFPAFCDAQLCYGEINGRILYHDTCHLNQVGSALAAAQFGRWLKQDRQMALLH